MVVVKLGGTNGSGKTSVARAVIALHKLQPVAGPKGRPEAYAAQLPGGGPQLVVLGSYATVCGGMDTISDKHERLALVRKYAVPGNIVLFEGLITGKTYGAMGAMSEEPGQRGRWLYTFMDTPYPICVERVGARRTARAAEKGAAPTPFDPERTLLPTFNSCVSTERRAREAGHATLWLCHSTTPEQLAKSLMATALRMYKKGATK